MVAIAAVLTPSARPSGLQSVANPLPTGWERGVDVLVGSIVELDRFSPCPVSGSATPDSRGEVERFVPVDVRTGIECSALGRPDTAAYARVSAEVTIWYALSLELYDGAATSNPSFADATALAGSSSVVDAICTVEAGLEPLLVGRLGVIHVPVGLACGLDDAVYRDGGVWRTHAGNLVAVHGAGTTVYGTGEIWAGHSSFDTRDYVDHTTNTAEAWADAAGLVIFDPAVNVSTAVT